LKNIKKNDNYLVSSTKNINMVDTQDKRKNKESHLRSPTIYNTFAGKFNYQDQIKKDILMINNMQSLQNLISKGFPKK